MYDTVVCNICMQYMYFIFAYNMHAYLSFLSLTNNLLELQASRKIQKLKRKTKIKK